MRPRPGIRSVAAAALGSLLLSACAAGGDPTGWSVEAALADVPRSLAATPLAIRAADVDAVLEATGTERSGSTEEDIRRWTQALTATGGKDKEKLLLPLPRLFVHGDQDLLSGVAGFNLADIDSFISVGVNPEGVDGDEEVLVVARQFDGSPFPEALPKLDDDVRTDVRGEDGRTGKGDATLDPTGVPTRFAYRDSAVAMGPSTDAVRDWLGDGETLADDEALLKVAKALDGEDVVSTFITSPAPFDPTRFIGSDDSEEEASRLEAQFEATAPATPFDLIAVGWAADAAVVVYHFNGEADAEALRANWENGITARREPVLEGYTFEDVKADGQIGVVRLSVDSGIRAQQLASWLGGEPLMSSR